MKVWVCSDGYYSSYRVTAVFTDEQRARAITKTRGWDNEPEAFECDPPQPPQVIAGYAVWRVSMYVEGDLWAVGPQSDLDEPPIDVNFTQLDRRGRVYFMWARDREHAIKIANERRIQWLAAGEPA